VDTSSKLANARSSADRVRGIWGARLSGSIWTLRKICEASFRGGNWPPYGGGRQQRRPIAPPTFPFPLPGRQRQEMAGDSRPELSVSGRSRELASNRVPGRSLAIAVAAIHYHAETLDNVYDCFAQIAEELRHQYALSYYPSNSAQRWLFPPDQGQSRSFGCSPCALARVIARPGTWRRRTPIRLKDLTGLS
jgi:hypothetical protein